MVPQEHVKKSKPGHLNVVATTIILRVHLQRSYMYIILDFVVKMVVGHLVPAHAYGVTVHHYFFISNNTVGLFTEMFFKMLLHIYTY